jgi:macrolide transport system ATP-binding/permease protein
MTAAILKELTAAIELSGIGRSYQVGGEELPVLKDINLSVAQGEFVAIMGPSGSGKSTLLQILGLLDRPTSGTYRLRGRDVSHMSDDEGAEMRSLTIGFVFQMFNLLPRTSALENVELPMIYSGAAGRGERARELLTEVGLADRLEHKPNELSGGQQQRVAIARALVNRPGIIFADEPTGNLASDQAEEILAQLTRLNREGITIVMVTHEADIAAYAKRVLTLKDGRIISDTLNKTSSGPGGAVQNAVFPGRVRLPHAPVSTSTHFARVMEYAASALRATAANKVRSALSMLGILIGVAAVIAMLAIGRGAQEAIKTRLAGMGSNVIMLFGGGTNFRGVSGGAGSYSRLTPDDAKTIHDGIPGVTDIYTEAEGDIQIVNGARNTKVEMQGVTPSYEAIRNAQPEYGRFFSEKENLAMARVVLLGSSVVTDIFGAEDPVNKTVKINREDFRVIGLLPSRGGSGGGDQDDIIVVPINTAMKRVLGVNYLHEMAIQCASPEVIPGVIDKVTALIRKRHRLPAYKDDDFRIRNNAEMQATMSETTKTMSLLLGTVALISLIVGGIGIMNIMLVSVNERTHEIGLRKAVGAPRRAILSQFLIETLLLSVFGGTLGVALGILASLSLSKFAGWTAVVTPGSVALAFGFSAGTGIIFGFWPARKASLLSPIAALRYE